MLDRTLIEYQISMLTLIAEGRIISLVSEIGEVLESLDVDLEPYETLMVQARQRARDLCK